VYSVSANLTAARLAVAVAPGVDAEEGMGAAASRSAAKSRFAFLILNTSL